MGRFPKFLPPRTAGPPQKLKFALSIPSPALVRVVGWEWNLGVPGGNLNFSGSPKASGTHPVGAGFFEWWSSWGDLQLKNGLCQAR